MGDEWNNFAELLANLIEKYAEELDLDSLPDPVFSEKDTINDALNQNIHKENVEIPKAA